MKISELIRTTEIGLEGTDLRIKVKNDISWIEYLEAMKISDPVERGIYVAVKTIVEWNLTDDDGKAIAITADRVKSIPKEIGMKLIPKITGIIFREAEKKKAKR